MSCVCMAVTTQGKKGLFCFTVQEDVIHHGSRGWLLGSPLESLHLPWSGTLFQQPQPEVKSLLSLGRGRTLQQQQAGFCPSPFLEPLAPTALLPVTPWSPPGSSFLPAVKHQCCLSQNSLSLPGAHSPLHNGPFSVSFYSKIPQAFSNSCCCFHPFISYF